MYAINYVSDRIEITCPYHPEFPHSARDLGGKWNGKAWEFNALDEKYALMLMDDFFGWRPGCKLVDIRVHHAALNDKLQQKSLYFGGRLVCRVFSKHDYRAKLGEGVIIVTGRAMGGGSNNNITTCVQDGTVFEIRNFPLPMVRRLMEKHSEQIYIVRGYDPSTDDTQSAINETEVFELTVKRSALMDEISKIDARIIKIRAQELVTGEIDASLRDED